MAERRPLTPAERDRLAPVLEMTDIPVRVAEEIEAAEGLLRLNGEATGWRAGQRRITLSSSAVEHLDDEQLRGLLAHEVGHQRGQHLLIWRGIRAIEMGLAVAVIPLGFLAGLLIDGLWSWALLPAALVCLILFVLVGGAALSRWMEYDADRRGATLLGSTQPLESLCRPGVAPPPPGVGDRLAAMCYPWPHPADRLASLEQLD